MLVRVIDAIMGTGKSQAAITHMNEHPDHKFIYITPYLEEAARIAEGCPTLHFCEPQRGFGNKWSKTRATIDLVREGRNIATTHQAFKFYTSELLDLIREQHYTMIIDEDVNTLETLDGWESDLQLIIDAGYVEETEPGVFKLVKDNYKAGKLRELFRIMQSREIARMNYNGRDMLYYWRLPAELLTAADDVYIMTYLFTGQSLYHFLEMHDIQYEYIGISYRDGVYRYSDTEYYVPEYVSRLDKMIHILEDEQLNSIGDKRSALSMTWYSKSDQVMQLKNNVYNFFRHKSGGESARRMWSTYASEEYNLRGKGYSKSFVSFNERATNKYRSKDVLAYCVNIYMNVGQKLYFQGHGVDVSDDAYALSTMVQWIWRSAIRDGREICLYIPSSRMRGLLKDWIMGTMTGGGDHHSDESCAV